MYGKSSDIWKLNQTLLNNQQVKEEIMKEILKYIKLSGNKNTSVENLWDINKAVLRGKFIVQRREKYKTNNLNFFLKKLNREEQFQTNISKMMGKKRVKQKSMK